RLTHVQLLLPWNLSPLQSSRFSLEYLLLPPRSALEAISPCTTHSWKPPILQDAELMQNVMQDYKNLHLAE
ncbi:hypothetical protein BYT27DRAFT_7107386, partial [Phlegmacium glaucopus]